MHTKNTLTTQALLIADETAQPALAAILQGWQNSLPPIVIIVTEQHSEQDYICPIQHYLQTWHYIVA